jgi:hypothetical protein
MRELIMHDIQNTSEVVRKHTATQLSHELAFFHQHKKEWLPQHQGEFVLIGKQTFGGFHKTYSGAVQAGVRMFGLVMPFLVEEIREDGKQAL